MKNLSLAPVQDFPSHEVQIATIGQVTVEMLRSKKAPNGEFLPASVSYQGKKIWSFKSEKEAGFDGIGRFTEFKGEYFIVLQDRKKKIHKIVPVVDLPKLQSIKVAGKTVMIGGKTDQELYALKLSIADKFGVDAFITPEEEEFNAAQVKFHQAQIEAENLRNEEAQKAKEAAHFERIKGIMAREKINAFTEDGRKCFGTPVIEGEWEMLSSDTPVILVDSLESKNPVEAFFVKRKVSGRLFKGSQKKVFAQKVSVEDAKPAIEAEGIIRVIKEGQLMSVLNFSTENFQLLRKTGLNSGTLVAVGQPDKSGKYTVVAMNGDTCETIGQLPVA